MKRPKGAKKTGSSHRSSPSRIRGRGTGNPTRIPSRPTGHKSAPSQRGTQTPASPAGSSEPVTSRLNISPEDDGKPSEERTYRFSIVDGSYKELVENFARMAGIGIVGDAPVGPVSFVTTETMDFKTALNRIRLLLFKYKPLEPYWLMYQDKHFEVLRVTDVWRYIPLDQVFPSLEAFEAAGIDDNELAMLRYTPAATSVADFTMLRDFMPDYVRIAPMAETNSLSIFALVKDIKKYLSLIKLFESAGDDPRVLAKLPIEHLTPSEAVDKLRRLMENDLGETGGAGKSRRTPKRGGEANIDLPGQRTILFPDDALGVIIIRAVPKKIEDVKKMLTFVDVPYPDEDHEPVLVPIVHADVNEILAIINPLVTGTQIPVPPTRRTRSKSNKGSRVSTVTSDGALSLLADTRTNTLIVRGTDEEVERVKRYVAMFDVPLPEDRPVFVPLKFASAATLAGTITQIVVGGGGKGRPARGEGVFSAIAEPTTNSLVLTGNKKDVDKALFLIEKLDVGENPPGLHSYRFRNAFPSTVMDIIVLLESQQPGETVPKAKGRRRGASGASNLQADDAARMLYVVCTDEKWTGKYLPLMKSMDEQAGVLPEHVSIPIEHLTPEAVIQTLTKLFAGIKPGKGSAGVPKMAPARNAVLVSGATAAQIGQIKAIIADIDRRGPEREQRMFTFEYADPEQIKAVIETGVVVPKITPRRTGKPGGAITIDAVVITLFGKTLIASGMPEQLDEIAELIEKLDVPAPDDNEMRVYAVPPGHDVQSVVALLESLLGKRVKPATRPQKTGATTASFDDTRIVAQVSTRRILVSAPSDRFPEIEKTIKTLLEGEPPERRTVKFVTLTHADPAAVAEMLQPILQQRMNEMVSSGEIIGEQDDSKKRRTATTQTGITLTPDVNNERIVVSAPSSIIAEAESLIAELDRPSSREDRIMRTITLSRSTPDEMVSAISAMQSGERTSPRLKRPHLRPKGKRNKGLNGKSRFTAATATDDVTIVSAPGGAAVILSGLPEAVDEVERWVKQLDETATTDTVLKVYNIAHAEVEQLADAIMDLCDTAAPKSAKSAASAEADLDFEHPGGVRKGGEITLTTDYWNKKILVRATPMKLFEVDRVVELYDGKEGVEPEMSTTDTVPYLIYELEHSDAYDATLTLENVLDVVWTHGDPPDVDYISGTDNLVVKCLPEYNAEIVDLIKKYVDADTGHKKTQAIVYETIKGASASEFAMRLKMAIPGLDIKLEQLGEDLPVIERLRPYQKCVLPMSLIQAAGAAALAAPAQTPPKDAPSDREKLVKELTESLAAEDGSDATDTSSGQVHVYYDDRQGVIVIKGPPRAVDEVKDALEEIKEEVESIGAKPDIRIFRIRYRNVNVAAHILESMFNAARTRGVPQRGGQAAQQRRLQQMQQRMQQMQQQMRGQAGAQPPGGQPGKDGAGQGQAEQAKNKGTSEIRVTPDPQTRSLIVRAATEDFPIIVELLATIDRPAEMTEDVHIFKLENLVASEVEEQLKVLLGVTKSAQQPKRRQPKRPGARGGGAQAAALQQIEDALLNVTGPGGGAIDAAADITITSYPPANTLLVRAPKAALDLIADLIEKLEAQKVPALVTRTYPIKNADATEVVERINAIYGGGGGQRGGRRGKGSQSIAFDPTRVTQVTATADARTNTVFVSAFEPDFDKIESLIKELDLKTDDAGAVQTYTLQNADATAVATTLNSVYGSGARGGGKRGGGGAGVAKFVGDAASNTLFYTAPTNQREDILARVKELDTQAGQLAKPKVIKLTEGKASEVARSLQDAFAGRGSHGNVKIVGDDVSNQLIITAPGDLFAEIQTLAQTMDQSSADITPRVFKLQHARATDVHGQLMDMVHQLAQQLRGKGMDAFTAVADERSNAIVAVGGPTAFALVEQVIQEIDVPVADTAASRTRKIVSLKHAEAADLARVINDDLRSAQGGGKQAGEEVSVIANEALNSLLVSGTAEEVDEVVALAASMDQPAAAKERVTRVYPVNYADPGSLVGTINGMFQQRRGTKPEDLVDVGYDWGTSKLVITANEDNHARVAALLDKVDDAAANVRSERLVKLQHADADELARKLQDLFRQTVRGQRGQQAMTITGDAGTNSLIVFANDAEFDRVTKLVTELDRKPEESRERLIKSFKLADSNPWVATNAINDLFKTRGSTRNPLDEVTAIPEGDTMSVIVAASRENMAKVATFIADFDQPGVSDTTIHVVELTHADGAAVHSSLQDMFGRQRRGKDPRGPAIQISNPQGTNTILVKANAKDFAEIEAVIKDLDSSSSENGEIEVIALQHSDAEAVKGVLETYLAKPGGGRGGTALRGDIRISANAQNNTIVVSGSAEDVEELKATIAELDTEIEGAGNAPKIIQVVHGRATQIEPILTQMFVDQQRGRGKSAGAKPPVIAADEASNTLIVRASASDFGQIEGLIGKLDAETGQETTFTIVPVAPGVQVAELAQMVETTINEGERIKAERWNIDPGTIVVTPDTRAGALVVAGTASLFPDVEKLVKRMEEMGPVGGITTTVINPKNISPDELKRLLDQLINENTSNKGTGSRVKGRRGSPNRRPAGRRNPGGRKPPRRGGAKRGR